MEDILILVNQVYVDFWNLYQDIDKGMDEETGDPYLDSIERIGKKLERIQELLGEKRSGEEIINSQEK